MTRVCKNNLSLSAVVFLALAILLGFCGCGSDDGPAAKADAAVKTYPVTIGQRVFNVELALTDLQRAHGLSGRQSMAADSGMLFIFAGQQTRGFHMIDCYMPIDVAFIDDNMSLVNYFTMAVESDPANPQRVYYSDRPVKYVLELPGGTLDSLGVKTGDIFKLPLDQIPTGAIK